MQIEKLNKLGPHQSELVELLQDSVESGASVGFIPPLIQDEGVEYWHEVEHDLQNGHRFMLAAFQEDKLVGSVQISISHKKNGLHRAEVEKLMVHTHARGLGIGRKLMQQLEVLATDKNRHLLVLDTRLGDPASNLYRSLGYQEAGQIPGFALSANGEYEDTCYFYKQL